MLPDRVRRGQYVRASVSLTRGPDRPPCRTRRATAADELLAERLERAVGDDLPSPFAWRPGGGNVTFGVEAPVASLGREGKLPHDPGGAHGWKGAHASSRAR